MRTCGAALCMPAASARDRLQRRAVGPGWKPLHMGPSLQWQELVLGLFWVPGSHCAGSAA